MTSLQTHSQSVVIKSPPSGPIAPEVPTQEQAKASVQSSQPERPAWLPEKFNTPEDLAKSYSELEKKMSSRNSKESKEAKEGQPAEQKTVQDAITAIDPESIEQFNQEVNATGNLSDETYKTLAEKHGIPREIAEHYVEGLKARAQIAAQQVYESMGGKAKFEAVRDWAMSNLPKDELDTLMKAVDSGDVTAVKMNLAGVQAKYEQAVGRPARLVQGQSSTSGGDVFKSMDEMKAAMADPRYKKDAGYRRDVENKAMRSKV